MESPAKIVFGHEKAIHDATMLFWKNGYSNTSLRDLLKAMGIGEGSFYNTMKSKKLLCLRCLKHYNEIVSQRALERITCGSIGEEWSSRLL